MKTNIIIALASVLLISSCAMQKRHYMKGYYFSNKDSKPSVSTNVPKQPKTPLEVENKAVETVKQGIVELNIPKQESLLASVKPFKQTRVHKKLDNDCDVMILKTGEEISCKVTEITLNEVKYKKCDNLNGPTISIRKSDVFIIKYSNGTKDILNTLSNDDKQPIDKSKLKFNAAAIVGFTFALIGGLIPYGFGVPLMIAAIILSGVGLAQIKNHPDKYKGKGFAIAGLILGIIGTAFTGYLLIAYFF